MCAGTTYSGYAYSFTVDHEDIHIMRKWEGDDPGNWRHNDISVAQYSEGLLLVENPYLLREYCEYCVHRCQKS